MIKILIIGLIAYSLIMLSVFIFWIKYIKKYINQKRDTIRSYVLQLHLEHKVNTCKHSNTRISKVKGSIEASYCEITIECTHCEYEWTVDLEDIEKNSKYAKLWQNYSKLKT